MDAAPPSDREIMKLLLYSLAFSDAHAARLTRWLGRPADEITIAASDNAADVVAGSEAWRDTFIQALEERGFKVLRIDLRHWLDHQTGLREALAAGDVLWLGGGNTYYLRWLLKATGADDLIVERVRAGTIYAGWSAGAMVAGPTLRHIEAMETQEGVPALVLDGLGLTEHMVVPHIDNPDFIASAAATDEALKAAGFSTAPLRDDQALIIDGDRADIV